MVYVLYIPSYFDPSVNMRVPKPLKNPSLKCPSYRLPSASFRQPTPCFNPNLFHIPSKTSPNNNNIYKSHTNQLNTYRHSTISSLGKNNSSIFVLFYKNKSEKNYIHYNLNWQTKMNQWIPGIVLSKSTYSNKNAFLTHNAS